ncbi:hypothetical protein HDU86_000387 [Geranomyces michiganensis]|nr:hypothetical protein HDU86_000387 [Geranomyces michiganensis]
MSRLLRFDAFPKVQKNIQHATGSGGLLTLLVGLLLAFLAASEFAQYRTVNQEYEFLVDQTRSKEFSLQINLDITIAMQCSQLRADVLDAGGVTLPMTKDLSSQAVTFHAKGTKKLADVVGKDHLDVHKIVGKADRKHQDKGSTALAQDSDTACRITGALRVNKVSGMLHFTALGHGYIGGHTPHKMMNFTHRIDKLSFGQYYPGVHNPLDRTLEISRTSMDMFQYFIAIVPTIYIDRNRAFGSKVILTSQYAVTDYQRSIEDGGAGGVPGIFIKYDIEPISVRITESRMSFLAFLTRFCGILGGIFVSVGILLDVLRWLTSMLPKPSKPSL